jgi:hypothetical protein
MLNEVVRRAFITGSVASVASTLALGFLGRRNLGKPAAMTNATSHWLWGDQAFEAHEPSLKHTGIGYATHHASAVFWAMILERWLSRSPRPTPATIVRNAALTTALAAFVDYGLTPRRLRPGFEQHLSHGSLVVVFAVLGTAFAAGSLLQRARRNSSERNDA